MRLAIYGVLKSRKYSIMLLRWDSIICNNEISTHEPININWPKEFVSMFNDFKFNTSDDSEIVIVPRLVSG